MGKEFYPMLTVKQVDSAKPKEKPYRLALFHNQIDRFSFKVIGKFLGCFSFHKDTLVKVILFLYQGVRIY
ncbi:hypothetical protein KKJ17_19760 [Xenorhabdus bovienii]|uniref:hypothetical protein n=2 Tax=Xenorhabdus bovienii TaxID=40576 RepID=UPI00237CDA94|nr:hypothetical protein [Xenorhabdus bovienii]MDE1481147.1 hypothetical protein [Xenorhabdus bovienii]MDE9430999.1 hypothetical protein [Xenorhabdus bovienii]MDE9440292.1 hypothetical protein [Xenorhabdus bovienii]MDE9488643.1 hypothetical protein [Xenorhabdus bovienii]MDE9494311.1 hypothetical protein [Xenorhabdus bovienii]